MKKLLALCCAVLLAFGLAACGGIEDTGSPVGGTIKCDGVGLAGVSILVDGESMDTTDANGVYSIGDFTEEVTVTPVLEGYTFMPESLTVSFAREDADFTATAVEQPAQPVEPADKTRIPAPTDGSLYDDFENGISPDGKWDIVNKTWGGNPSFNGVNASNVNYTADGILVLSSKGMYWENSSERNTGAAIATKEALGPGKFEVAAKISPRLGMCSAIWTYYYQDGGNVNSEIDIEFPGTLNGRIGYDSVMNTNYTSESTNTHATVDLSEKGLGPQNDGKWHKYGIEWSVKDNYVRYYIDDVLTFESNTTISPYEAQLWIGVWLPNNWAGVPEYETSDMLIDWVAYTPYDETAEDGVIEANEEYLERSVASENSFPTEPITLDENAVEIVSNSDFSGIASAWTLSDDSDQRSGIIATDYTNSDRAYRLIADSSATQTIGAVYGGFEYTLSGSARVSGGQAEFAIEFMDETGAVIGEAQTFTVAEGDAFAEFSGSVTAPEGSVQMRLVLRSAGENAIALFDSISMHRVIDLG